jgi:hypothetical protein
VVVASGGGATPVRNEPSYPHARCARQARRSPTARYPSTSHSAQAILRLHFMATGRPIAPTWLGYAACGPAPARLRRVSDRLFCSELVRHERVHTHRCHRSLPGCQVASRARVGVGAVATVFLRNNSSCPRARESVVLRRTRSLGTRPVRVRVGQLSNLDSRATAIGPARARVGQLLNSLLSKEFGASCPRAWDSYHNESDVTFVRGSWQARRGGLRLGELNEYPSRNA